MREMRVDRPRMVIPSTSQGRTTGSQVRTVSDYTPNTDRVRAAAVDGALITQPEFDRWLATVKAEALTEVAGQMRDRFTAAWIRGKAREYTHGPHKPVGAFAIPEEKNNGDQD